jgi:hypothetical protein
MSGATMWATVDAFLDCFQERRARRIPPTDDNRLWFEQSKRSRNGWPRLEGEASRPQRVRAARATRDPVRGNRLIISVSIRSPARQCEQKR